MLADSKLPHTFWAEALSTCAYLRNCSPTRALEGITSYEAWSGIKPDVSLLQIFGCSAYVHVPKVEWNKLDFKTRKCVLLGYGTSQKGYHLYDVERMNVVHSRDVFDETSTPGIQKETTVKYVELEINEKAEESTVEYNTTSDSPGGVSKEAAVNEQPSEESLSSPSKEVPRRSTRHKQIPNRYGHNVTVALTEENDPSSVAEAKSAPSNLKWEEAMKTEMESLWSNEVWELVD